MIWKYEGTEYNGKAISIDDWAILGEQVKGHLLDDLKYQKDDITRMGNQASIQMRDYDMFDVLRYSARKDVRYDIIRMIFKNDKRVDDKLISSFINETEFLEYYRKVLESSGVSFVKEKAEDEINPPQSEQSAEPT